MKFAEFLNIQEMAQSEGDPAKVQLDLDDEDRDFVSQAVHKGITPGSAIRARYEILPQMQLDGDGPVDIKFSAAGGGKAGGKTVTIERPHYTHLIKKLKELGLENAAIKGLQAFSRVDAKNFLSGREDKNTGEKRYFLIINHEKSRNPDAAAFNADNKHWGQKIAWEAIESMWKQTGKLNDDPGYDDVLADLKQLVGKQIKPEVWEKFIEGINDKNYLKTITNVVASTLRQVEETDTIADRVSFKQVVRQVMAKMLIWGAMTANDPNKPNDFGKMLIELPAWVNKQSRIETSWVTRHWFNKRLDKYARSFQAGKEHDAATLADMGKQVIGREAPSAPEDELDKEPEQMPAAVANRMNQPAPQQQQPQQDFDYDAWQRQQDQEGDDEDIAAYRKRSSILPARREWSFVDYVKARDQKNA